MGKSVKRAANRAGKRAEQIHEEVYGKPADDTLDPDAILDDLNGEPVPSVPSEPPAEPAEPPAEPTLTVVPESGEPPAEPVPTAEAPTVTPEVSADDDLLAKEQHKYSVLQGMHRKLLEDNNDLRTRLDALEAAPVAVPEPSPVTPDSAITASDVEDYGNDLIDMVKRAAHEEISPELARLQTENDQLKSQMTGVTSKIDSSAKESIYSTLAKEVPTWEQTNNSEEFLFWLAQRDPFSGQRRHDLLTQAFGNNDSARVITFFKAFLNEDMTVAPSEPSTPAVPATPAEPKIDLVSMAAPGRAQSGGKPSNQTDTRIYTRHEISAYYKAVQLGKFTGTAADKKRIEKAFVLAANEGRVT